MKNWESFYVPTRAYKEELLRYLKKHNIYAEPSACGIGFWFEILCTEEECEMINNTFFER